MTTSETGEFGFLRNEEKQWRWVYTSPRGSEFLGPGWHKTKKLALAAGQSWLEARCKS
jgi:hypothetical protein